jgi:hypothetical protein
MKSGGKRWTSSFQMSLRYSAFEKVSVASMLLFSVGDPGFKESEPEAFSPAIIESIFDADRHGWLVFQELVWCRRIFEGKEEKRGVCSHMYLVPRGR